MSNIDNQQSLDQDRLDAEQEQIARLLRFAGPRLAICGQVPVWPRPRCWRWLSV